MTVNSQISTLELYGKWGYYKALVLYFYLKKDSNTIVGKD
jgi:hypothetical protein